MIYNFTYWKHFTFAIILEHAGVYFIDNNVYTIDRVFIEGEFGISEFIGSDVKKIHATFALDVNEVVSIAKEIEPIRWKAVDIHHNSIYSII